MVILSRRAGIHPSLLTPLEQRNAPTVARRKGHNRSRIAMTVQSVPQNPEIATETGARIPLIHQLHQLLIELEPLADGLLIMGHRALAQLLRCSAGILPRLMRQLESQGIIARTRIANMYAITVIVRDRPITNDQQRSQTINNDHSATSGAIAQSDAEYVEGDHKRSQTITPHTTQHDQHEHEHACSRAPLHGDDRPAEIATKKLWTAIQTHNPGYTAADYEADVQAICKRRDIAGRPNAVRVVIHARSKGLPLYAEALEKPQPRQAPPNTNELTAEQIVAMLGDGWTAGGGHGLAAT